MRIVRRIVERGGSRRLRCVGSRARCSRRRELASHTVEIEAKTYYFRRLHHYKRARIDIKVAARLRCLAGPNKL
jgi:hypothetical protein